MKKIDKRSKEWKSMSKEDKELYNQLLKDSKKQEGLGDKIEKITEATGIKKVVKTLWGEDCGCEERKEILNNKLKGIFKRKEVLPLEENEYLYFKDFFERLGSRIQPADQKRVLEIYNRVFKQNHPPSQCTSCWRAIVSNVRRLYNEYVSELN